MMGIPLALILLMAFAIWLAAYFYMRRTFGKFGNHEAPEMLIFLAGSGILVAIAIPFLLRS